MEVISSRISGWRVTDSMTLPKMMPMPTPAPTAPRPPPTPSAIARPAPWPALSRPPAWAKRLRIVASTSVAPLCDLVVLGDSAAEVDGREGGEDERLKGGDQADLEEEQDDPGGKPQPRDRGDAEQHREPARHEQDDQMPGED